MSHSVIVIPCYNESQRLDVDRFVQHALADCSHRFLFVNDGSTDSTLDVISDLCEFDGDRFSLLDLPVNVGKAEAVRQGVLSALDVTPGQRPRYVGYWDADLATPLEAIDGFTRELDEHPKLQLVMGARVRLLGRTIERRVMRHYLGRVFAAAASRVLRLPVYDTQCGAKLFRVSEETCRLFVSPFLSNWIFDVEILARLAGSPEARAGMPIEDVIYELPLRAWRDVAGSKVRARDFFKAAAELVGIYRSYLRPSMRRGMDTPTTLAIDVNDSIATPSRHTALSSQRSASEETAEAEQVAVGG